MPNLSMSPYAWLILGAILVLAEVIVPGFIIFFFGVGCLVTGLLMFLFPMPDWLQLIVFIVSSVVLLFTVRKYMPNIFGGRERRRELPDESDEFAGEPAVVAEDIPANGRGKVTFHGSLWEATSDVAHAKGENVTVQSRKNLVLTVK